MLTMEAKLKEVFAKQFNIAPETISAVSSPSTIGTWDSLNHIELILQVEDAFGVGFGPSEVFGLTSFGDIHSTLAAKLGVEKTVAG